MARACAASSAVPILLTPITLKNYAGSCGFNPPEFLSQALEARDLPDRQFDLANNLTPFMDSERKPYIHLVDGGVADNLGLRALLERVIASGNIMTNLYRTCTGNQYRPRFEGRVGLKKFELNTG